MNDQRTSKTIQVDIQENGIIRYNGLLIGHIDKDISYDIFDVKDAIPHLTHAQIERLVLLAEECGETIQSVCKILRHGYDSGHPDSMTTNRFDLEKEIGDIYAAVEILDDYDDIRKSNIKIMKKSKLKKVWGFLHHNIKRNKSNGQK